MLKKPITYETFDGEKITEDFYFNISVPEFAEMDAQHGKSGWAEYLQQAIRSTDTQALFGQFKDLILRAYGEKSDDGKLFLKKDLDGRPLSAKFEQSAAYISLFTEITSSEEAAVTFCMAVLPEEALKKMADAQENAQKTDQAAGTPPTPPVPPQS